MKHLFKRGLSLLLAALMVVSMLPVSALADYSASGGQTYDLGADADPDVLTPISGQSQDGESSEHPPLPGGEDVEDLWETESVTATVNEDGTWEVKVQIKKDLSGSEKNAESGSWWLAIVPDEKTLGGSNTPTEVWKDGAGDIGASTSTAQNMVDKMTSTTGQARNTHFIVVTSNTSIRSDEDGVFTIKNSDSYLTGATTSDNKMPDLSTLLSEFSLSGGFVSLRVFFYAASSDKKVISTTTTYGEPPAQSGIPSTVYLLNKTTNTLTFVSGTLNGAPWTPDGVSAGSTVSGNNGSWSAPVTLNVPVYNRTSDTVTLQKETITSQYQYTTQATLGSYTEDITSNSSILLPLSVLVDSGTIVVPITATDSYDGTYTATITITIFDEDVFTSGGTLSANPIIFRVVKGSTDQQEQTISLADGLLDADNVIWTDINDTNEYDLVESEVSGEGSSRGVTFALGDKMAAEEDSTEMLTGQVDVIIAGSNYSKTPAKVTFKPTEDMYDRLLSVGTHTGITVTFHGMDLTFLQIDVEVPVIIIVEDGSVSPPSAKVDVTYNYNDDNAHTNKVVTGGATVGENYEINEPDPTWAGHTFTGWTVSGGATVASGLKYGDTVEGVTGAFTLTAQWEDTPTAVVTIRTVYDDGKGGGPVPTAPGGDVVLKPSDGSGDITLSGSGGEYTVEVSKLTADSYDVWVNGFKVGSGDTQTVSAADSGQTKDVTLYRIYIVIETKDGPGPSLDPNKAYMDWNEGSALPPSPSPSHTEFYAPEGARSGANGPYIVAKAVAAEGYYVRTRMVTGGGSKTYGEFTWTSSGNLKWDPEKTKNDNPVIIEVNNLRGDSPLTAQFAKVWTVTTEAQGASDPGTDSKFTQGYNGSVSIDPDGHSAQATADTLIKTELTLSGGDDLDHWEVKSGKLYSDEEGTSEIKDVATCRDETVYFLPGSDGAQVIAHIKSTNGSATVTLNKNNDAWDGDDAPDNVELRPTGGGGGGNVTLPKGSDGQYTGGDIPAGTYHVYVGGADTGETVTVEAGDTATAELNYYTLKLVRKFNSGAGSADIKVGFTSASDTTAETTFLAGADPQNIFATQTNKGVSASGPYYTFENWSVTPDSTGSFGDANTNDTTYTFPDAVTLQGAAGNDGITLTANYTAETYTVNFYRNWDEDSSGDVLIDDTANRTQTVDYNGYATEPTAPTRTGYTFSGWSKEKSGATVTLSSTPITEDTNFYAIWTQGESKIVFDLQDGETIDGSDDDVTKTGKTGTQMEAGDYPGNPTKTGYTFQGWTVVSCSSGTYSGTPPFNDGNKPYYPDEVDATLTLKASWQAEERTVTYNVGKNTGATIRDGQGTDTVHYGDSSVTVKTAEAVLDNMGTAEGWTFTGWKDEATGTTYNGSGSDTLKGTITDNVTLTAQWTVDVTFHANKPAEASGETLTDPGKETPEAGGKLDAGKFGAPGTLKDYEFEGWYKAVGGDDKVDENTEFNEPTELYAHWKIKTYTLTFDPDGGTLAGHGAGETVTITGEANSAVSDPGTPTKDHYDFGGWYWSDGSDSVTVSVPGTLTAENNGKTLKAKWTDHLYKYTFDPNEGTFTADGGFTLTPEGKYQIEAKYDTVITPPTSEHNPKRDGYAFKGWARTQTGTTAADAIDYTSDKVKMPDAEETTVYAIWEPLYNIKYEANGHGSVKADADQTGLEAGSHTVKTGSEAINGSWDGSNIRIDDAGNHWRFNGWNTEAGGGGTSITGGTSVVFPHADAPDPDRTLTLYAQWVQQYKVTFGTPGQGGSTELGATTASATFGETGSATNHSSNYTLYVDAGKTVSVGTPTASASGKTLYYAYWQADNGTFTGGEGPDSKKTTQTSDTFRPSGDATLTPYFWVGPAVSPNTYTYDIGKTTGNLTVKYTWTVNDATWSQLSGADYQLTMRGGTGDYSAGAAIDISKVKGVDGGDGKTYTFTFPDDFLKTLEKDVTYTITFASNTPDGATANRQNTDLTAELKIEATANELIQVDIQAQGGATTTVKAEGEVEYRSHTSSPADSIVAGNLLTYKWYYRDTAPTQTTSYHDPDTTSGEIATAIDGAREISGFTGPTVTVPAAAKGKYVFAVVTATVTGKGLAITNSVPVDYDAAVKVTKDGDASITDSNYKVYLVPTDEAVADSYTDSTLPGSKVEAAHTSDNIYKTADNALTGGKSYAVYANVVEGETEHFVKVDDITISTQTSDGGTIEYFSVNAVDTAQKNATDSTGAEVGETFSDGLPTVTFATTTDGVAVTSGNGVLTGTAVTAKTSKTFDQDYHVDWGTATDDPSGTLSSYTETKQEKAEAFSTGHSVGEITQHTWVGAQLEQNVYDVTGYVWVNGGGSGGIMTDTDNGPTLTVDGHIFKPKTTPTGTHRTAVTFSVPRNVGNSYTIHANGVSGSIVLRYAQGNSVSGGVNDETVRGWGDLTGGDKNQLPNIEGANATAFVIVVEASRAEMTLRNDESDSRMQSWRNQTTPATAPDALTESFRESYLSYEEADGTYTFTLENTGNVDLKVTLAVEKDSGPYSGDLGTADTNGVTFSGMSDLGTPFDLPIGETKTFTVQIPEGMKVDGGKATYTFKFTSTEDGTGWYGPSLTYQLTTEVKPLTVEDIDVEAAGDVYTPKSLKVSDKTQGSGDFYGDQLKVSTGTDDDVVYEWYAVDYGTKVWLNQTDGKLYEGTEPDTSHPLTPISNGTDGVAANGATYTENAEHAGQSVYLVARGVGNSGNVVGAAFVDPPRVAVPFQMGVQILENGTPTDSNDEYAVYLVPREKGTPEVNAAKPGSFSNPGVLKGVYSSDGTWMVEGLNPELTYEIWTNAMAGADHAATDPETHMSFSGVTTSVKDFQDGNTPKVNYYDITIEDTKVDNQRYNNALQSVGDSNATFLPTYTSSIGSALSGALADWKAPTATVNGETATEESWIRKDAEVKLTYKGWNKDYKLTWGGVTSGDTVDTGSSSDAEATVTVEENTTVTTTLQLNLYDLTAHVVGENGSVTEIQLKVDGLTLTTKASGSDAYLGLKNNTPRASISAGGSVVFSVPKATYTATATGAAGTNIEGYRTGHAISPTVPDPKDNPSSLSVTVNDVSEFDVVVSANGKIMSVTDNASSVITGARDQSAEATYDAAAADGEADQAITLPFNYNLDSKYQNLKLTLTVDNESTGLETTLYDVDLDQSGKGEFTTITVHPSTTGSVGLDGSQDMEKGEGDEITVDIDIPTNLGIGEHEATLIFSFLNEDGVTEQKAQVTYKLTVTVVPDRFTAVTTDKTTVKPDETVKPESYTTTEIDLNPDNGIVAGTDYTYIWYYTPSSTMSLTGTWDPVTAQFTPSPAASATKIDAGTAYSENDGELSAEEIAKHQGEKLWLVIAAKVPTASSAKVIEAAVATTPVTVGYQPVVKVTVDDKPITADDATHYTVQINDQNAVWDNDQQGYVPTSDGVNKTYLDSDSYTVKASPYKDKSDSLVEWSGSKTQVDYYTVNAVEVKAYEGITGRGETFDLSAPLPTLSFTLNGSADSITTGTPVLRGQAIDATAGTWTQDYKLTWYTKVQDAGAAPTPGATPTESGAYANTAPTMTPTGAAQSSGSASTSDVAVSGRLYIGARLDQNVYNLVGSVTGTSSGYVSKVTVKQTDVTGIDYTYPGNGTPNDKNHNSQLDPGDTVTFRVTKGTYTITAEATGAAVKEMSWNSSVATPGAELTGNTVAPGGTPAEYPFTITLETLAPQLKVTDDTHEATGGVGDLQTANNEVEHYVHYIDKKLDDSATNADDLTMKLKLENPGNTDMTVNLQVYRGTATDGTKVYDTATDSGSTVEVKSADTLRTVLDLTDVMSRDTTVAAGVTGGTAVNALTVTVNTGAFRKDSGTYTFRFTGTSAGGTVTVDYVLTLKVDPLPIKKVTTTATPAGSGSPEDSYVPGPGDTVEVKGYSGSDDKSLENVTVQIDTSEATATASEARLTTDDVKFAWFYSTEELTEAEVKAGVTVAGDSISATPSGRLTKRGDGAQYTLETRDLDGYLYVVAYAPNGTVNASEMAASGKDGGIVSPPFETKKTAKVQVSLNSAIQPTVNTTDPGYTIYLVEDSKSFDKDAPDGTTGTWSTTWSNNTDKAYQAAIDMDTTYHVYAPIYKGSDVYVDTGLTVGKGATNTATVPYWSVAHTANVPVDNRYDGFSAYLPTGKTATDANALQGALSVKISDDRSNSYAKGYTLSGANVPVLGGMHVKVTVDSTAQNNNSVEKKAWSDFQGLHTLTATGEWADGAQNGITYPVSGTVEGKDIEVTARQTFSAKLEQVLFTVVFKVKDETPGSSSDTSITGATLKSDIGGYSWTDKDKTGRYGNDATVTFENVPVGTFTITAAEGMHTLVQGYKWDGADGNTVTVTTDTTKNQNTDDGNENLIRIARGSNKVNWKDNFVVTTGKADATSFYDSTGFARTDDAGSGHYFALYNSGSGYDAGEVLTYTVQVHNTGSNNLEEFTITPDASARANFTFDLTKVEVHSKEGGLVKSDVNVQNGITSGLLTLEVGQYVQFTVTIPVKTAQASPYTGKFTVSAKGDGEALAGEGRFYDPTYKVNAPFTATEGKALVHYGDSETQFNAGDHTDVKAVWPAANGADHSFKYEVVDAAGLGDLNTWLGANGKGTVAAVEELPGWLTLNDGTGAITFQAGQHATGVNVQTKTATGWGDYAASEVNNERVVYVKITDTNTNRVYYTTYTIDMEPGQLSVEGASFDDTGAEDGKRMDLSKFSYTGVQDQAGQSVAGSGTGAAGGDITWSADPATYKEGSSSYTFTGAYKTGVDAEKWNYKPATDTQTIEAAPRTTVTLTYDVNGHGSLPAGVEETVTGEPPLMVDHLPTLDDLTDYTFKGWSRNEHATAPDAGLTGGASYTVEESTTLYAVWEAKIYTYTFHANGGAWAGGAAEKTVTGAVGAEISEPDAPTWADHTLLGWKDTAGAGGADITFPTTMPSGGGHAYAQWELDQSTIVYHWNYEGADPESEPHNGIPGKTDDNEPMTTRTGYSIEGWYTEATCENKAPDIITFPAKGTTVDYYAKWVRDQSTVTFDLDGGSIGGDKGPIEREGNTGDTMPNDANPGDPVKDDYTFKGWTDGTRTYDFDDADPTNPAPSYPSEKGGKLTLKAVWERNQSNIVYHWNDGATPERTVTNTGPTGEPDDTKPTPTRADYTFDGWYTEATGGTKVPDPTFPDTKGDTVEYYAHWTATIYTYTFRANGGAWADETTEKETQGAVNAPIEKPADPTWEDHTFLYWGDAEGNRITVPEAMPSGGGEAYAVWELDEAELHYDWGVPGAPDVPPHKGEVGKPDPNVPSDPPSNPGYVWDGKWYDPENNPVDEPTFPAEKNGQLELHAGWRALSVALKFEDVRSNAGDVRDGGARITLVDPDATLTDMTAATPMAREVTRSGEYVVYLDTVPTYTVTLTNVGDKLEGMTLKAETTDVTTGKTYGGFLFTAAEALSALDENGTYTFTLTPDKLGEGLYAGTYHVKLTATGTAEDGVTTAEATYEITFQINKKTITKADVTGDKVTGKTDDDKPGDPDRDLTKPDDKGVIPVTPKTEHPNGRTTVTTLTPDPNYEFVDETEPNDPKEPTNTPNYTKNNKGDKDWPEGDKNTVIEKQEDGSVVITTTNPGGGGGGGGGGSDPVCPNQVSFLLGLYGTTKDATMEMVANNGKVSAVPTVSAIEGYKFLGWSQTGPTGDLEADAKRTLVDPKTVTITGDTVFYAVYQPLYTVPDRPFHEHYVIGYPNGNFGPGDNIDRASVATIIARAVLPNFVEGADYGNPLGYSDVAGHWAASAIAYCSKYGVFTGYEDGTFRPSQPISRQELALVMARLNGVLSGTAPFSDIDQAGDWAKDGIYTAYTKGWVNGYTDGTFKPLNPIRRDETVKIFNAYLGRGVDAKGLSALHEYVHSGVASNNTENGTDEYMTWPDVTADQWAYYEIIEAANDHEFATDSTTSKGYTVPETWTKCWIDERWRYHDDPNDGGPALAD